MSLLFYLFFILTTLFLDPQLIQNWSLKSVFDPHQQQNICYVVILRFMLFHDKSVYLLTCVMFTRCCCYFKYHTCIFIGLKNIHRFLIYLWISKRFVDLSLFCGFEKDLPIWTFFVDLTKIWRFLIILWIGKRFVDF